MHSVDYNKTFTTDALLSSYQDLKNKVLSLSPTQLTKLWTHYLSNDQHCDQCYYCEKLKHIHLNIVVNEPFSVQTGELVDSFLILTRSEIKKLNVNQNGCVDQFTGKILVTWIIEKVFKNLKLPNYITLHMGWVCNHIGYTLYTAPTVNKQLGTISHFDESLLTQLIVIFDALSPFNFRLGIPNIKSLLVNEKPCSYQYKNKKIISPLTLMLGQLNSSSIQNIKNCQLFNDAYQHCLYILKEDKYKIHHFDIGDKHHYPASIDFYLLLLSVKEDVKDLPLYQLMWPDKDNLNDWLYLDPFSVYFN